MTPADHRVLRVLKTWLASIEQHIDYLGLDDRAYWRRREWVAHRRPSAEELDVAKRRVLRLIRQVEQRIQRGDGTFSDSLELMSVVTSMVARENVESFIPLIEPEPGATRATGRRQPAAAARAKRSPPAAATGSRTGPRRPGPVAPDEPAKPVASDPSLPPQAERLPERDDAHIVIADAVRLLSWGRQWFELGDLIPTMHGRPSKAQVRSILSSHRAEIEALARIGE